MSVDPEVRPVVIWVAHRREEERAWLAELPPHSVSVMVGAPQFEAFREAPEPHGVVLGLEGDCGDELRFALELCERFPRARWWLAGEAQERDRAERLFDCLPHHFLDLSTSGGELRAGFETAALAAPAPPLSRLRRQVALSQIFRERFADLDPELFLPLIDPAGTAGAVLIEGERGVGRRLLARYVQGVTEHSPGPCVEIDAREISTIEELWGRLQAVPGSPGDALLSAVLVEADALPEPIQVSLAAELELGILPSRLPRVRLFALVGSGGSGLTPDLRQRFRYTVRIPPLRERPRAVENFVRAWSARRGKLEDPRLPGWITALSQRRLRRNYRDLERLLERALLRGEGDGDGTAPAPEATRKSADGTTPPSSDAPRAQAAPAARPPLDLDALSFALAHELRNPLSTLRTFTTLFPEQYQDEEFRVHFGALASRDVARMVEAMELLERYQSVAAGRSEGSDSEACDLAALAEGVIRGLRETIDARKLVVLEELERGETAVRGRPDALRFAVEALVQQVLEWVEDGRDLYLSVRRAIVRGDEAPAVRLLVRFPGSSEGAGTGPLTPARASLALTLASAVFAESGGELTLDTETELGLLAVDLPAA
jgi:signal transduction histidine kinase